MNPAGAGECHVRGCDDVVQAFSDGRGMAEELLVELHMIETKGYFRRQCSNGRKWLAPDGLCLLRGPLSCLEEVDPEYQSERDATLRSTSG